jgi:glycosyltransferase involved in cell wall biosynthesis
MDNISILLPIYNRSRFKRLIISNLLKLDYDLSKLEVVISDDSNTDPLFKNNEELNNFKQIVSPIQVNYIKTTKHMKIGEKRNFLVKNAKYKICANMDSDDLYLSNYLKHSLKIMKEGNYQIVTSPQMLFIYPFENWLMTGIDCGVKRMGHEATMIFTKKHFKAMQGFTSTSSQGEGTGMIDGMRDDKIGRTEIGECMVCICHQDNTINKDRFKTSQNMNINLDDFDKQLILSCLNI